MARDERFPITRLPREGIPEHAIVCGDPARAERIGDRLVDSKEVGNNREFLSFQGTWKGVDVVVSSHGVGAPGALCLFEELALAGVRTVIRVGTCGSLRPEIEDGHNIVATACVRDDGATPLLIPPEYPAFANHEVVTALETAAAEVAHPWHLGLVWTRGSFFPGVLDVDWDRYERANVIAVEMELSALLVFASLKGLRAGGILTSDGGTDISDYDPHRGAVHDGVEKSVDTALRALHLLANSR
jgi:uridine phosphorylase